MYSDISIRTMASSLSNSTSAKARANSVLPTPVGPKNRKEPMGRFGFFRPDCALRTARETAFTASSWPITRLCRISSMCSSRWVSSSRSLVTGTPVQLDTMLAISSSVTTLVSVVVWFFHSSLNLFSSSRFCFSWSRYWAAFSYS